VGLLWRSRSSRRELLEEAGPSYPKSRRSAVEADEDGNERSSGGAV